jgi:hypothetical protein
MFYNHRLASGQRRLTSPPLGSIRIPNLEGGFQQHVEDFEASPEKQLGESKPDDLLDAALAVESGSFGGS